MAEPFSSYCSKLFFFLILCSFVLTIKVVQEQLKNKECYIGESFSLEFNPNVIFNSSHSVKLEEVTLPNHLQKFSSDFQEVSTLTSHIGKFASAGNKIYNYFTCTTELQNQLGSTYCLEILDKTSGNYVSNIYPFPSDLKLSTIVVYVENNKEYLYGMISTAIVGWEITNPSSIQVPSQYTINFSGQVTSGYFLKIIGNELHFSFLTANYGYSSSKALVRRYDLSGDGALDPTFSGSSPYLHDDRITDFVYIKDDDVGLISFVEYSDDDPSDIKHALGGFYIYDTSGDSSYKSVGSYTNSGNDAKGISTMIHRNGIVYALEYSHYDSLKKWFKVSIFDASDHLNIHRLGEIVIGVGHIYGSLQSTRMEIQGDYLYAFAYDELVIVDVSDSTNPKIIEVVNGDHFSSSTSNQIIEFDESILISGMDGLNSFEHSAETINGTCEAGRYEISIKGCAGEDCTIGTFTVTGICQYLDCKYGVALADCTQCSCDEGYFGDECESYRCNKYLYNDDLNVCGGFGKCIYPEICECGNISASESWGYDNLCNKVCLDGKSLIDGNCVDTTLITGIVVSISCAFGCIILSTIVVVVVLVIIILRFRKKSQRFNHIEGIDMIVKEAELEQKELKTGKIKIRESKKADFIIDFAEIELKKVIGEGGSSSTVYLAEWKGEKIAYKGFKSAGMFNDSNAEGQYAEFEKEVQVCVALRHPSILQWFGVCVNPPKVGICMEFAQKGDIPSFFSNYLSFNGENYPIKERIRILKEIVNGMEYLHSKKLIHRDLKPENVLINGEEKAKIMDFGLTRQKLDDEKTMTKCVGTSFYMAPEVIKSGNYSFGCDMYSFAIMAFVVITDNFYPFGDPLKVTESIVRKNVSKNPSFRPTINREDFKECSFLIDVIKRNWSYSSKERNSFTEVRKIFAQNMEKEN